MTTYVTTADAKEEFSELINRVSHNKECVVLTRRGKEVAAIVPLEDFYRIQQSQSKSDLDEAVESLQEARTQGTITLEDLQTKIG